MTPFSHTIIIGHRGHASRFPENTMASFRSALETHGAPMIEFDVHLSRDSVPVIILDHRIERTTEGKGYVSHFSAAELGKFDAGYRYDPDHKGLFPERGKGHRISTLEEVVTAFSSKELSVEIKDRSAETTGRVMAVLKKHGAETRCVVGSRYSIVSRTLRESFPGVRRFYSQNEIIGAFFDFKSGRPAKPDPGAVASMPLERCGLPFYDPGFIHYLHQKNVTAYYWTINDPALMRQLAEAGADGLITDDPALGLSVIPPRGTAPKDV